MSPVRVRYFADWSSYNVYGDASANNYVNILNYYSSTYSQSPKFYGGINVLPQPISLPADMSTDTRASQLVQNAGLTLPAGYSGYDATKGVDFTVDLTSDGKVTVKQYLGLVSGFPAYGPARTFNVTDINNAMIVKGNIRSLKGVLKGRLTIAAMKSTQVANAGNIDITGSVQYASKLANTSFAYADPKSASLFTNNGADLNQTTVNNLLNQSGSITDTLGLISENNILIKEKDLNGNLVAAGSANPVYIDAVVMATGAASTSANGGQFGAENPQTRTPGYVYHFGGSVQNSGNSWALYSGSTMTNGLFLTRLWDNRNYQAGGGPPSYPVTGVTAFYPKSWRASYVKSASDAVWLPQ